MLCWENLVTRGGLYWDNLITRTWGMAQLVTCGWSFPLAPWALNRTGAAWKLRSAVTAARGFFDEPSAHMGAA